jgi:hypothetical protein
LVGRDRLDCHRRGCWPGAFCILDAPRCIIYILYIYIYIYIYIYKVFVVRKKSTLGMLFYDSLPCCKQTRGTASQTLRTMRPRSWPSTPASPPRSSDHLIGADGDHHQRAGLAYQPADQASPHTLQEIRFQGSRKDSILTENMFIRA